MTRLVCCHYCGWHGAKVRVPGDPPTCWSCRDLPKGERERDAELERAIKSYYAGDQERRG